MRKRAEPHTFEQRLNEQRHRLEDELVRLPIGRQRDAILARIEQLRHAADMHEYLSLRDQAAVRARAAPAERP
jgi:hypothetical protein